MSDTEPVIIKEFRSMYDYIILIGRHINQINSRLEKIEEKLKEINFNYSDFSRENSAKLTSIKENTVSKEEFNNFVEKMNINIVEMLPPLPTLVNRSIEIKSSQESITQ